MPAPGGANTLIEAMWRLDAAKIELVDIALRRPSLDDVFLSLTKDSGKRAPSLSARATGRDVMTVPTAVRPRPSALQQWWVLTVRSIVPTLRNGELVTAIAASVIFTAGFYIPLNEVMGAAIDGMSSYAQFLMPLIVLQAISFAAMSGGVSGGNRLGPRHQSAIRLHADRPGDTVRRPHVGQRVPVRRSVWRSR